MEEALTLIRNDKRKNIYYINEDSVIIHNNINIVLIPINSIVSRSEKEQELITLWKSKSSIIKSILFVNPNTFFLLGQFTVFQINNE